MEDAKLKKNILIASIALFVISLTQKCYCTTTQCSDSIMAFLLGWLAAFSGGAAISWLANPLLIVSWFVLKRNLKIAMFLSMFAFLISLSFLLFDSVTDNESGGSHPIISHRLGYWLWIASTSCMLIGTFVLMLRYNTRRFIERTSYQRRM